MGSNARFQKLMEQEIEILKWWVSNVTNKNSKWWYLQWKIGREKRKVNVSELRSHLSKQETMMSKVSMSGYNTISRYGDNPPKWLQFSITALGIPKPHGLKHYFLSLGSVSQELRGAWLGSSGQETLAQLGSVAGAGSTSGDRGHLSPSLGFPPSDGLQHQIHSVIVPTGSV